MSLQIKGEYPREWSEISYHVKEDAGWRCIRCRHPFELRTGLVARCDEQCVADKGVHRKPAPSYVTLAGIPPYDERLVGLNYGVHHFDGDKSNCQWWNLMAMCNSCHLSIQARVVPERPWLFEHSQWAHPYVGGFYAWWFAGRHESRVRIEATPRFFLAVGQPWLYPEFADAVRDYIAGREYETRLWAMADRGP